MPELPDDWIPISAREQWEGEVEAYETLHSSPPSWLGRSLWEWVRDIVYPMKVYSGTYGSRVRDRFLDRDTVRQAERLLRFDLDWDGESQALGASKLESRLLSDGELMVKMLDFLLARLPPDHSSLAELHTMLIEGGSLYGVAADTEPPSLRRRVGEQLESIATEAIGVGDTAGRLLAAAWTATFGLDPSPSEGYRNAVRAVEAAAIAVIIPNDDEAHLGRVIGTMKDTPVKLAVVLPGSDRSRATPVETVISMMELIWTSQYDRHVRDGTPLHIDQPEADAAVPLATVLVHWFQTGAVDRA